MTSAALLAGVATPVAVTTVDAAGSGTITATSVPAVSKDASTTALGTVKVTIPAGQSVTSGDVVVVKLPGDFDLNGVGTAKNIAVAAAGTDFDLNGNTRNKIIVPTQNPGTSVFNGITAGDLDVLIVDEDEIKITVNNAVGVLNQDAVIQIALGDVKVSRPSSGTANMNLEAASNSAFPTGSVAVASVDKGKATITASSVDSSNDSFNFKLNVKENTAAALVQSNESIKLKLPNGFEWTGAPTASVVYGNAVTGSFTYTFQDNNRTLVIDNNGAATNSPSLVEFTNMTFRVTDEDDAKKGDVVAKISGDTDTDVTSLVVGKYGEYKTDLGTGDVPEVLAGKDEQKIATLTIKEQIANTFIDGRTILVKLPEAAVWGDISNAEIDVDGDASFETPVITGNDGRTLKLTIDGESAVGDDPTVVTIEDLEILTKPGYEGDIEVEFSGSAGVTGKAKVATAVNPFAIKATSVPEVIIGQGGQLSADFVISEKVAESFEDNGTIVIDLPDGVKIDGKPEVKVTKGDLKIGAVDVVDDNRDEDGRLELQVTADSTEASEISITGFNLIVDRTVPVGDIKVRLLGTSTAETAGVRSGDIDVWKDAYAASGVIAKVITPAPTEKGGEAVFTIGSTSYTVNGESKTLDVAPFIEAGRTYLPIRFAAEAAGADFINWDQATQTATILKGDRVASMKLNSKSITVNGGSIAMDVPVKLKNDRVVLPLRFVGQALGNTVDWNEADQTVTVK